MPDPSIEPTVNEASHQVGPDVKSPARRQLLALGTAICGATVAGAIFNPARADLVAGLGKVLYLDPIVFNFAFELEELESDFFNRLSSTGAYGSLTTQEQNVLEVIAAQDREHFQALVSLRDKYGYKAAGKLESSNTSASRRPRTFKTGVMGDRTSLLSAALDLKENALFAYHGAVGLLKDPALLEAAASIAGVEGRHVAVLREVMGLDPVPAPFEGALEAQVAGRKLAKFGFNGGAKL
jgi:hypothetical protein